MRSTFAFLLTGAAALFSTSGSLAAGTAVPPGGASCDNERHLWMAGSKYKEGDRLVGARGNLYVCKGGAAAALCDDPGYQPDFDERATEAWEFIDSCVIGDGYEARVTELAVSNLTCQGTKAVITLTATVINESPFAGSTKVSFFNSADKTLIATETLELTEETVFEPVQISTTWRASSVGAVGAALITVIADDDGKGFGNRLEYNESDNFLQMKLPTCPIPKPGPL